MGDRLAAARIKRMRQLCDQLDALRKQAEAICADTTKEIRRAEQSGQRERRNKTKKVRQERRRR